MTDPLADGTSWPRMFLDARDTSWWNTNTRAYTKAAESTRAITLSPELRHFVYWLGLLDVYSTAVSAPELTDFVNQFTRLVGNLGQQRTSRSTLTLLETAIDLMVAQGACPTTPYLGKADYYARTATESTERLRAIKDAVAAAKPATDDWARAIIALAWYQVDTSRYSEALSSVGELRQAFAGQLPGKYECGASALAGVALFTSLRDLDAAETTLDRASAYRGQITADPDVAKWVQIAVHYLGRIAEIRRDYPAALTLLLESMDLQRHCPEDVQAEGFAHLRVADLLVAGAAPTHARDHLDLAERLFRQCATDGAATVQLELGWAACDVADGDLAVAEGRVRAALDRSTAVKFWRGELLCLGYLLTLYLRAPGYRRRLPWVGLRILRTVRTGELRRNGLLSVGRLAPAFRAMVRRLSPKDDQPTALTTPVMSCPCGIHNGEVDV